MLANAPPRLILIKEFCQAENYATFDPQGLIDAQVLLNHESPSPARAVPTAFNDEKKEFTDEYKVGGQEQVDASWVQVALIEKMNYRMKQKAIMTGSRKLLQNTWIVLVGKPKF